MAIEYPLRLSNEYPNIVSNPLLVHSTKSLVNLYLIKSKVNGRIKRRL